MPALVRAFPGDARPLTVVNAGCSPDLGRARLFHHRDGRLVGEGWLPVLLRARRAA